MSIACAGPKAITRLIAVVALMAVGSFSDCTAKYLNIVTKISHENQAGSTRRLFGEVLDKYEQPIIGATISVIGSGNACLAKASTDIDGKYATAPLPPDSYTVIIETAGFGTAKVEKVVIVGDSDTKLICQLVWNGPECILYGIPAIDLRSTTTGAVITDAGGTLLVEPH